HGRQSQSIDPSRETSATVRESPRTAYSPIGVVPARGEPGAGESAGVAELIASIVTDIAAVAEEETVRASRVPPPDVGDVTRRRHRTGVRMSVGRPIIGRVSDQLLVRGAREHNLRNISVELPRNQLIVFTGLSGSGKSSLAFDTIFAEGQRRYVESLSAYARQFLGQMDKPDVDFIEGLSPAVSIDQKSTNRNPRSTVGTITEVYDYLRLLYSRAGTQHCPVCGERVTAQTP